MEAGCTTPWRADLGAASDRVVEEGYVEETTPV